MDKRRVLLTGASGFVGRRVAAELSAAGRPLTLLLRPGSRLEPEPAGDVRVVRADDMRDAAAIRPAFRDVGTVVHLAGRAHQVFEKAGSNLQDYLQTNLQATVAIAEEAMACGVRSFLFMSTIGVLGQSSGEDGPLTDSSRPAPQSSYSISKLAAEMALATVVGNAGGNLISLRPTLVCGIGAGGNLRRLLELSVRGLPIPFGGIGNRRTLMSLDDLASAVAHVLGRWETADASGTYVIGNARPISLRGMIRAFQQGAGRGGPIVWVPRAALAPAVSATAGYHVRNQLFADLEVDSSRFRREFGWDPPDSTVATLAAMGADRVRGSHSP